MYNMFYSLHITHMLMWVVNQQTSLGEHHLVQMTPTPKALGLNMR